jgi:predicted RNA-binding protein associated with RNAse of E/G family
VITQPTSIASGDWRRAPYVTDYRSELLDTLLVERATWGAEAPLQTIGGITTAAPSYIWFRFWFAEGEQVIEKYFDAQRQPMGYYLPVSTRWKRKEMRWSASSLILAVWLDMRDHLTVLHENTFDAAIEAELFTPVEVEQAEQRIRRLTLAIVQKRLPPPLVRNFAI